jgi:hypothetical protein
VKGAWNLALALCIQARLDYLAQTIGGARSHSACELDVENTYQKGHIFLEPLYSERTSQSENGMAVNNKPIPLLLFCALFSLVPAGGGSHAAELVGRVRDVIDGSSFYLCNTDGCTNVRICGIDAPHQGQSGWARSLMGLHTLLDNQSLRCVPLGEGTVCDGRTRNQNPKAIIAQCFLGQDVDIAALLVKRAFACDWVRFSGGHYSATDPGAACVPP